MTSEVVILDTHLMSVDAAPVQVIANPPFVVSADKAMPQLGVLSKTVVAEFTSTVVPALAYLRIKPSTFQAAQAVPSAAC